MNAAEIVSLFAIKTLILGTTALFAWGLLKVLPIRSPGLHRLIWGGILLLGVFGAGFPVTIPVENFPETIRIESTAPIPHGNFAQPDTATSHHVEVALVNPVPHVAVPEFIEPKDAAIAKPTVSWLERFTTLEQHFFPAVLFIWIGGIVMLSSRRMFQHLALLQHLKTAIPASGSDATEWFSLLKEYGIRPNRISLLLTDEIGPALVRTPYGMAVVVPENLWREANGRVKSGILRHELAHYLRHDLPLCFIVRFLSLVHWFNPFSWLAAKKFEEATEWACDVAAFGNHELGELHFAESLLAIHEATPRFALRYSAFASGRLSRRASLLRSIITQPKESIMKKSIVLFVVSLLLIAGAVHVRFVLLAENEPSSTKQQSVVGQRAKFPTTLVESFDPKNAASEHPTMTLTVLDPDGKPIAGATGKTHRFDNDQQRIFKRFATDEDGKAVFELPKKSNVGTFTFTVQTPGYTPFHGRWERENYSGDLPSACSVKLEKAKTVGGIVQNEDGTPVAEVKVEFSFSLERHTNGHDHDLGCPCEAMTDAEGRWTYGCVPEDVVKPRGGLTLLHADYLPTRIDNVSFANLVSSPDGVFSQVSTIRNGLAFSGTVKDESGKPIADAKVQIEFSDVPGGAEERSRQTTTDAEGRFTLPNCPVSKRAVIVGFAAGFAGQWLNTTVGPDVQPVELVLPPGKPIKLRIVDTAGKPIRNAYGWTNSWGQFTSYGLILSQMLRDEKNWGAPQILPVDDTGLWTWNDAPAGPITITVEAPGFMGQRVELEGGKETKTITLAMSLQIAGKVVDDATGKPIPQFNVTEGMIVNHPDLPNQTEITSWQTHMTRHETNGTFSCQFNRPENQRRLRVEADGYEPSDSRVIGNDEGSVELEFRLKRLSVQELARQEKSRNDRSGRIETPDGKPAAHATIIYATSSPSGGIGITMHYLEGHSHRSTKSDKEGRFTLPPILLDETINECYAFVVVHDSGFTRVEQADFEKTYDTAQKSNALPITLQPWATVEGIVKIGAKPTGDAGLDLSSSDDYARMDRSIPRIDFHYSTKTDHNARFKFTQVAPAHYRLARILNVQQGNGMSVNYPLQSTTIVVQSGETKAVSLGGTGRPVIGRVDAVGELQKLLEKGGQRVTLHAALPPMPRSEPPELPEELQKEVEKIQTEAEKIKDDPEKLTALQEKWFETESGKKIKAIMEDWQKNDPTIKEREEWNAKRMEVMANGFMAMIGKDGLFCIEDVPSGDWTIRTDLYKDDFQHAGAAAPRNFTIPAMPDGGSDESFDLGTISIK